MKKISLINSFILVLSLCACGANNKGVEYNINYFLNGGVNANNPSFYSEDMGSVKLKDPRKISSTFKGWYTDSSFTNQITKLDASTTDDLDIYAKWADGIVEKTYNFDLGIGKRYVIYQVSDTHVNAGTSPEDIQKEADRLANSRISYALKFHEEYNPDLICKESTQGFINIVNYVNGENPDVVCYSGDLMDYYSKESYEFIKTEIAKTNAPFSYAMGNHERPTSYYQDMPGVINPNFAVQELDDFEIFSIDNSNGGYTDQQYDLLLEETKKNKPIIILQHMPIVTEYNADSKLGNCGSYYYIDRDFSDRIDEMMIDLICSNENIKLILCGHIHGSTETEICEGKTQITCSSGLMGNVCKITIR